MIGRWYNRRLAGGLVRYLRKHAGVFRSSNTVHGRALDVEAGLRATTLREFDSATIVPLFGYADVNAYYADSTVHKQLGAVGVPLLALHALDDPVCSPHGLVTGMTQADIPPNVIAAVTREGGHVAWAEGWMPGVESWDTRVVAEWVQALAKGHTWDVKGAPLNIKAITV